MKEAVHWSQVPRHTDSLGHLGHHITAWSCDGGERWAERVNEAVLCSRVAYTSAWVQLSEPGHLSDGTATFYDHTREAQSTGWAGGLHKPTPAAAVPEESGGCSRTVASSALLPLLGTLPFLLAQHLPLPLQVLPQFFCLAQVALCGLLFALLQLSLVQAPEPPHLLLVLGDEFLDLGLQTCGDRGCTRDGDVSPLLSSCCPKAWQA